MKALVPWDHLIVVAIIVLATLEWRLEYPRFKRALQAGVRHARVRMYATEIIALWALSFVVAGLWIAEHRPGSGLLLGSSSPLRLAIGWTLSLVYVGLMLAQRRALLARPQLLPRLAPSLGGALPMMPTTRGERNGFYALSLSAGMCEELLFRGYVLWYGTQWAGPVLGFAASTALFGYIHRYFDAKSVLRTAIVGALFYVMAVSAGSLWPAVFAHVMTDVVAGNLGYHMLRQPESGGAAVAPFPA